MDMPNWVGFGVTKPSDIGIDVPAAVTVTAHAIHASRSSHLGQAAPLAGVRRSRVCAARCTDLRLSRGIGHV